MWTVNNLDKVLNFIAKKEVYGTVIIIIIVFILNKIVDKLVDKLAQRGKSEFERKRKKTIIELIKTVKMIALFSLGIIFILDLFGINVTSLITSLGIASALFALALQDTLKDIISGATIVMDNYYVVGDYVKYNNFLGTIIQLGLKSTKIQDVNGQVYTIANRNINEIINLSQKSASPLLTIPTAYEADIETVEKVLKEVVEEIKTWETVDKEKTSYLGILELGESSIDYGIRYYCSPANQWKYKWAALRLIKMKYDENDIKIPYKQIEVHNAKH